MQNRNLNQNPEYDPFFSEGAIEIRSAEGGGEEVFCYWAVYDKRSRVMTTKKTQKKFVEIIKPGSFANTDFSDARSHFDHGPFLCAEPTLQYGTDAAGAWLKYRHDPHDPAHVSAYRAIVRGDAKGASFQFPPLPEDCYTLSKEGDLIVRTIHRFPRVVEFGPVITPAYKATTTFIRSLDEADDSEIEQVEIAGIDTEEQRDMSAAYDANTNPTPAQKVAGNFKKGKVRVAGMDISIENPIGSVRSGVSNSGEAWEREMFAHYGYILGSKAIDGDNLDVFLTDDAEGATLVFVVDQIRDGTFDEHKCVIGPATLDDAAKLYLSHYPDGWTGLGAICYVPMDCFYAWAMDGTVKKKPLMYDRNAGKLYGPYLDAMRTVLEAGGTPADKIGTPAESAGTFVEGSGSPLEPRGIIVELPGTPAELPGNSTEQQRNAAELLEKRKLQIRATLM